MKRLLRLIFAAFALLCLVLGGAIAVLGVRSRDTAWLVSNTDARKDLQFGLAHGELWVYRATNPPAFAFGSPPGWRLDTTPGTPAARDWGYGPRQIPFHFDHLGLAVGWGPYAAVPGRTAGVVILPCWLVVLVAFAPAVLWLRARRNRRRARSDAAAGLCPACGYDLRATPDRCPECGAAPAARATPSA